MGTSISRLRNPSRYENVQFVMDNKKGRRSGRIGRGGGMNENDGNVAPVNYQIVVYDKKGRAIKWKNFSSWNDATWEIHEWGLKNTECNYHSAEQKMKKMFGLRPGATFYWDKDLERHYNEEDQRADEHRQREEAQRREEQRKNEEADKRHDREKEADLKNTSERTKQVNAKIALELEQRRTMTMMKTQQSIGWRTQDVRESHSKANNRAVGEKEILTLARAIQDHIEAMESKEALEEEKCALAVLDYVFKFLTTKPIKVFDLFQKVDTFLERELTVGTRSPRHILNIMSLLTKKSSPGLMILDYLPISTLKVLLVSIVNFKDHWNLISNEDSLDAAIYLFRRMGRHGEADSDDESMFDRFQVDLDVQLKFKMVYSLLVLPHLPGICGSIADVKHSADAHSAVVDVLKMMLTATSVYPKQLIEWYVELLVVIWSSHEGLVDGDKVSPYNPPVEELELVLELLKSNTIGLSPSLLSYVSENVGSFGDKVHPVVESILRVFLESGMLTHPLLSYLIELRVSKRGTSFSIPDILGWMASFVWNGGQAPSIIYEDCLWYLANNTFNNENQDRSMEDIVVLLQNLVESSNVPAQRIVDQVVRILSSDSHTLRSRTTLMRILPTLFQNGYVTFPGSNLSNYVFRHLNFDQSRGIAAFCVDAIASMNVTFLDFYPTPGDPMAKTSIPTATILHIMLQRILAGKLTPTASHCIPIAKVLTECADPTAQSKLARYSLSNEAIRLGFQILEKYNHTLPDLDVYWKRDTNDWLSGYLNHINLEVRESALSLCSTLLQHGKLTEGERWRAALPQALAIFSNWESELEHTLATQSLCQMVSLFRNPPEMKEGETNSEEDEPKPWVPPLTSIVGKFEQFATPSGFSCKEKLVDNCATVTTKMRPREVGEK